MPFSAAAPKSSGMSSLSGPMKFDDAPPGCTAPTFRPPLTPPASSITSRTVVPIGTQYTSGRSTCPDTAKNFHPTESPAPWSAHHCAPRCTITGTSARVSTELISVGRPCSP